MSKRAEILNFVIKTVEDLVSFDGKNTCVINEQTAITGTGNILTSLQLINCIVTLEQYIEETFGKSISLLDVQQKQSSSTVLGTVGSIADFLSQQVS